MDRMHNGESLTTMACHYYIMYGSSTPHSFQLVFKQYCGCYLWLVAAEYCYGLFSLFVYPVPSMFPSSIYCRPVVLTYPLSTLMLML
jgi:hypothetical protein